MNEQQFQNALFQLLERCAEEAPTTEDGELLWPSVLESEDIHEVRTFADDGVLTNNKGLTVRLADGSAFQLTIVKSR